MIKEEDGEENELGSGLPPQNMMNSSDEDLSFGPPPQNMMNSSNEDLSFAPPPSNMKTSSDDDLGFETRPTNRVYHISTGQHSILPTFEEFLNSKGYDLDRCSNGMLGQCTWSDHRCRALIKAFSGACADGAREVAKLDTVLEGFSKSDNEGIYPCLPRLRVNGVVKRGLHMHTNVNWTWICPLCFDSTTIYISLVRLMAASTLPNDKVRQIPLTSELNNSHSDVLSHGSPVCGQGWPYYSECIQKQHLTLEIAPANLQRTVHHNGTAACDCPLPCYGCEAFPVEEDGATASNRNLQRPTSHAYAPLRHTPRSNRIPAIECKLLKSLQRSCGTLLCSVIQCPPHCSLYPSPALVQDHTPSQYRIPEVRVQRAHWLLDLRCSRTLRLL